jgi:hypothetical protein
MIRRPGQAQLDLGWIMDGAPMDKSMADSEAITVSQGETSFSDAIRQTLSAPADMRAAMFEKLALEIERIVAQTCPDHPWTSKVYNGLDGSRIFRGGVGTSLVIDLEGRLWRARNYEDFETTYRIEGNTCEIETLRPIYSQMRQYVQK